MEISIKIWRLCLYIYLLLLTLFVVIKFNGSINDLSNRIMSISENRKMGYWNKNLIPLRSAARYFVNISDGYARLNILGNIVPFMPLGFLLPFSRNKAVAFFKNIGSCFLVILSIEIFQLITMLGFFDIDDIWLNLSGCMIGYTVYIICTKIKIFIINDK